jgi:hypothetical protein
MIEFFKILLSYMFMLKYVSILTKIFILTYLYRPLYIKCNIKKKIKKGNKIKIICSPKCMSAFIYFALLSLILYSFSLKVILFLIVCLILGSLIFYDYFTSENYEFFDKINKNYFILFLWKIFHSIFTIIYNYTEPINMSLDSFFNKKILKLKKIITTISNFDNNSFDKKDISEINKQMKLCKKDNDVSITSGMSQYIVNSNKSEIKIKSVNLETNENSKQNKITNIIKEPCVVFNSSNSKEEMIEIKKNIDNIFFNSDSDEIDDITFTEIHI